MITRKGVYTFAILTVLFSNLFATIFIHIPDLGICASPSELLPGDPRWNPGADLDGDGVVNILDLAISASAFGTTSVVLKGVSWYGIDSDNPVDFYKMTEEYFNFMIETFPGMNFLCLPISAKEVMPNIDQKDYNTINNTKLNLIKDFVSWCKVHNIKILIINNWEETVRGALWEYWKFVAEEFLGESTIAGFDIINEPWSFIHTWEGLIAYYDLAIDAIQSIDPDRICYVQSMYYHYESAAWRDVLINNPVNRSNVVYVTHLYSNNANTGEWYDMYTCPWVPYYLSHDYEKAKEVLRSTTEGGHGGLYERFGFIQKELGYPVAVTELGFVGTEEGLAYGRDVLEILNEWNISWAYHSWYTNKDRPVALTYPNGTLRPQTTTVQNAF